MLSCLTEMAVGRQSGRLASARLLMLLVASLAAARFHETDAALRPVSTGLDASLMPEMQRLGSLWPSARRKFRAAPLRLGLWGYVEVRPKAHMFWWLQTQKQKHLDEADPSTPLVIWLQGGPGASGTGFGQFTEVGPYGIGWEPRKHAWTEVAHVLFVDNPVGTGFSYVEDGGEFATTNQMIGVDLVSLLGGVFVKLPQLRSSPVTIVCESYGGKMGVAMAQEIVSGRADNTVKVNLKGLALGDSWIHPLSFVLAWGNFLQDISLLDASSYESVMGTALDIQSSVEKKQWEEATDSWARLEALIETLTDNVNFYNVLQHNVPDVDPGLLEQWRSSPAANTSSSHHYQMAKLRNLGRYHGESLSSFMNGEVREALGSIPSGVIWGGQSSQVFDQLKMDFMRHVSKDVDGLLMSGVNITVYNGQLDLICCTKGVDMWMKKLSWEGIKDFYASKRRPLYPDGKCCSTGAFLKEHKNLSMYYILNAGHMVPSDAPEMALHMLVRITSV